MFTVSPSIYSADFLDLRNVLDRTRHFEHLHLDIDDGHFVQGISFGMTLVGQIASATNVPLDVHLETTNPMDYIDPLIDLNIPLIFAHVEALDFPGAFLSRIKNAGLKAGLALNPRTPVCFIAPYADQLDHLLLVSVESGDEGLSFRKTVLKKIEEARQILGRDIPIWVDGGINGGNLKDVIEAGADGVVIGRAVFKADDYVGAYEHFIETGRRYEKERGY